MYMAMLRILFCAALVVGVVASRAQSTVVKEDFSGSSNIFGVTSHEPASGRAALLDSGLEGFRQVLTVCKATAEAAISTADGQPVTTAADRAVTIEWDAFHGYLGSDRSTTVTLLNSEGKELGSYVYTSNSCQVTAAKIGGSSVAGFQPFSCQSRIANGGGNGFGGNGKPYVATPGYNPHITTTLSAEGNLTMAFTLRGATTTLKGSVGSMRKDIALLRISSTVDNSDRCYAIDNLLVSTHQTAAPAGDGKAILCATVLGPENMTFGANTSTAYKNSYTLLLTATDGTTLSEQNAAQAADFNVTWDIEGFKTENDTEGQYCDSYGSFSVNGKAKLATTFDLRDVPMNFYGCLKATIVYNGATTVATKHVVALGNQQRKSTQVLPLPGYPADFSSYSPQLDGYSILKSSGVAGSDIIVGGWCVAGNDSHTAVLTTDTDGTRLARLTATTRGKRHLLTHEVETPTGQLLFSTNLRLHDAGAVVAFSGGSPFKDAKGYRCPVALSFDGKGMALNGAPIAVDGTPTTVKADTWYRLVLSADKSSNSCYAMLYSTDGQLLGESGILPWATDAEPIYFSIGMDNGSTGTVDVAACEAFKPTVDTKSYKLSADKVSLSIPDGETARLAVTISDENGLPVTGKAIWSVQEEDMRQSLVITPDEGDTHRATVSLSSTADAGTATIQVSIGGVVATLPLTLTTTGETLKFAKSTSNITIPLDETTVLRAEYAAEVVDAEGAPLDRSVVLTALKSDGTTPYVNNDGISFNPATGVLSVTSQATPTTLVIRATSQNSDGQGLTRSLRVNIHHMKFDFGFEDSASCADGYTAVGAITAYTAAQGYGISRGMATEGGTQNSASASADYLSGDIGFDIKVQPGAFYTIEITYQGVLTTAYINSDLAGYELGTQKTMATATYTLPVTTDKIDLRIAAGADVSQARIASIVVTKQAPRKKRSKRVVHHIGDSTSANNGSWAYRLSKSASTYPELFALCDFQNNGAGGRNLSTYYTQGKLAAVLSDIYPDDIVMLGNNGTNGMGNSFEADVNYYLDAAEMLGAKVIINSYTPHGAVSNYSSGYNATTQTFNSYRRDSYETVVRRVAQQRAKSDENYLGFVEIGINADAIFNAYTADYAELGYANANAAAQAIIGCFTDHNHYSNGTLACDLMLQGYANCSSPGIVSQLVQLLSHSTATISHTATAARTSHKVYTISGQQVKAPAAPGLYIIDGRKVVVR